MAGLFLLLALLQAYIYPAMSQGLRRFPIETQLTSDQNIQVPQTPCPQFFRYQYGVNGWTGLIAVPPPNTDVSLRSMIPIKLEVQLRVFGLLPTKYVGRLELAESKNTVLQKVLHGDSARGMILYRLYFPTSANLPILILITVNGNTICTGNPNLAPSHGRIITSISLEHTFYPSANALNVDNAFNNNNNNNRGQTFNQRNGFNQGQGFSQAQDFYPGQNFNQGQNFDEGQNFNGGAFGDNFGGGNLGDTFNNPQISGDNDFQSIPSTNTNGMNTFTQRPASRPRPRPVQRPQIQKPVIVEDPHIISEAEHIPEESPIMHVPPYIAQNRTPSVYEQKFLSGQFKSCGKPLLSNLLVAKGKKVRKGAWPWLAAMFKKSTDVTGLRFICGGTLILDTYVITAAHCVAEDKKVVDPARLLMYLGKFNLESWTEPDVQAKDVRAIYVHPDYRTEGSDADIALLRLSSKVVFNQFVQPACLWPFQSQFKGDNKDYSDLTPLIGRRGTVMGWGRDEFGSMVTSEPRFVNVPVVSQRECFDSHHGLRHFTSNRTLCAGSRDGSGPCNGDSGGGLMFLITDDNDSRWFLRGIVSLSLTDASRMCDLKNYIVYSDVAKFGDWLSRYIDPNWLGGAKTGDSLSSIEEEMNSNWEPIPFKTL